MDEMIHVDAHAFDLGIEMLHYKDYLYKLLITRYGLSTLANDYLDQIISWLKALELTNTGYNAQFVLQILGENQRDVWN
jgi:hypothetical protein